MLIMFSIQENPSDNKSCCSYIKGDQYTEEIADSLPHLYIASVEVLASFPIKNTSLVSTFIHE
jgi:hypothetical protein